MLALDATIGCIEASAPDVLAVYRSAPLITTGDAGSRPESREAYVCAIRKKSGVHVYVALVADNRRIFVYTTSGEPDPEEQYDRTLQEALDFTISKGFAPERVNLDYGSAMREVVLRNLKILRPPGSKVNLLLRRGMADAPTPVGTKRKEAQKKHSAVQAAAQVSVPLSAQVSAQVSAPAVPVPVAARVAVPIAAPVTSPAVMSPAVTSPVKSLDRHTMAANASLVMAVPTAMAPAGPIQHQSDKELTLLRGALSRITDENRAHQKQASQEIASLRENLARALSDSEREREQQAAIKAELLKDQKVLKKGHAEALSKSKDALAKLSAERDAQSMKVQELSALQQVTAGELAQARAECRKIASAKSALELSMEAGQTTASDGLAALKREASIVFAQLDEANRRLIEMAAENAMHSEALTGTRQEVAELVLQRKVSEEEFAAKYQNLVAEKELLLSETAAQSQKVIAEKKRLISKMAVQNEKSVAERERLLSEIAAHSAQREAALLRVECLEKESAAKAAELEALHAKLPMRTVADEMPQEQGLKVPDQAKEASDALAKLQSEVAMISGQLDEANRSMVALAAENAARSEALTGARQELAGLALERKVAEQELAAQNGKLVAEREVLLSEIAAHSAQREAALLRSECLEKGSAAKAAELEILRAKLKLPREAVEPELPQEQGRQERKQSWLGETRDFEPAPDKSEPRKAQSRYELESCVIPAAEIALPVARERLELPDFSESWPHRDETDWHGATASSADAASIAHSQEVARFSAADDDFFPSAEGPVACPGRFLLQPGQTAIEYASPGDVRQLNQSINVAYLSPEGKGQESCQGYICCIGNAAVPQVYVALFGTKSGRTWVYLPEVQPADQEEFANAVKGAISFAEDVGFLMEEMDLGSPRRQSGDAVLHCPVLRCEKAVQSV